VIRVEPLEAWRLRIWLASGQELLLDLSDLIDRREAYWRLRHPRYFRQVAIDPLGGLCWPDGEDLAPDGLERYVSVPAATDGRPAEEAGVGRDGVETV